MFETVSKTIEGYICNACPLNVIKGVCPFGERKHVYSRPDGEPVYVADDCRLGELTFTDGKSFVPSKEVIQYSKKVLLDKGVVAV